MKLVYGLISVLSLAAYAENTIECVDDVIHLRLDSDDDGNPFDGSFHSFNGCASEGADAEYVTQGTDGSALTFEIRPGCFAETDPSRGSITTYFSASDSIDLITDSYTTSVECVALLDVYEATFDFNATAVAESITGPTGDTISFAAKRMTEDFAAEWDSETAEEINTGDIVNLEFTMENADNLKHVPKWNLGSCTVRVTESPNEYVLFNYYQEDICVEQIMGTTVDEWAGAPTKWRVSFEAFTFEASSASQAMVVNCSIFACHTTDDQRWCSDNTSDESEPACDIAKMTSGRSFTPRIDYCVGHNCINGSCESLLEDFQCNCNEGYEGAACETELLNFGHTEYIGRGDFCAVGTYGEDCHAPTFIGYSNEGSWQDAIDHCLNLDGILPSIQTDAELDEMKRALIEADQGSGKFDSSFYNADSKTWVNGKARSNSTARHTWPDGNGVSYLFIAEYITERTYECALSSGYYYDNYFQTENSWKLWNRRCDQNYRFICAF